MRHLFLIACWWSVIMISSGCYVRASVYGSCCLIQSSLLPCLRNFLLLKVNDSQSYVVFLMYNCMLAVSDSASVTHTWCTFTLMVVTHADERSRGSKCVHPRLCVGLFVHTIEPKLSKLESPDFIRAFLMLWLNKRQSALKYAIVESKIKSLRKCTGKSYVFVQHTN